MTPTTVVEAETTPTDAVQCIDKGLKSQPACVCPNETVVTTESNRGQSYFDDEAFTDHLASYCTQREHDRRAARK